MINKQLALWGKAYSFLICNLQQTIFLRLDHPVAVGVFGIMNMVCERMTIISSFLFYCCSVQSSALYLPRKLYIAKETVSSCHFIFPYYLLTLKQL